MDKKIEITEGMSEGQKKLIDYINSIPEQEKPSLPHMNYIPDADILTVYFKNYDFESNYYGEWQGPWKENGGQGNSVSLLKKQETNEIIGVEIWGVKDFLESLINK